MITIAVWHTLAPSAVKNPQRRRQQQQNGVRRQRRRQRQRHQNNRTQKSTPLDCVRAHISPMTYQTSLCHKRRNNRFTDCQQDDGTVYLTCGQSTSQKAAFDLTCILNTEVVQSAAEWRRLGTESVGAAPAGACVSNADTKTVRTTRALAKKLKGW